MRLILFVLLFAQIDVGNKPVDQLEVKSKIANRNLILITAKDEIIIEGTVAELEDIVKYLDERIKASRDQQQIMQMKQLRIMTIMCIEIKKLRDKRFQK